MCSYSEGLVIMTEKRVTKKVTKDVTKKVKEEKRRK